MKATNLYGGAITANFPKNAIDTSRLREVPDNQEVWVHPVSDQSIIIDILEYAECANDEEALEYHLNDILKTLGDDVSTSILSKNKLSNSLPDCDSISYIVSQQNIAKYKESAKNLVNFHIVLFRFKKYQTDILVTFNDTQSINPESSSFISEETNKNDPSKQNWSVDEFLKLIESFRIQDYSLFVVE